MNKASGGKAGGFCTQFSISPLFEESTVQEAQHELIVSRLVARIAELEELVYAGDLKRSDSIQNEDDDYVQVQQDSQKEYVSNVSFSQKIVNKLFNSHLFLGKQDQIQNNSFKEKLQDVEAQREAAQSAKRILAESFIDACNHIELLKQKNLELTQLYDQSNEELNNLHSHVALAKQETNQYKTQVEAHQREKQLIEGDLQYNKIQLSDMQEKVIRYIDQIDQQQRRLDKAQNELHITKQELAKASKQSEEYMRRFLEERLERRRLQKELQTLRGSVRVLCRMKPLNAKQQETSILSVPMKGRIQIKENDNSNQNLICTNYEVDQIFDGLTSQEEVFAEIDGAIQEFVLQQNNLVVVVCGAERTGKTYTMIGRDGNWGICMLSISRCFEMFQDQSYLGDGQENVMQIHAYDRLLISIVVVRNQRELFDMFSKQVLDESVLGGCQGEVWKEIKDTNEAHNIIQEALSNQQPDGRQLEHLVIRIRPCSKSDDQDQPGPILTFLQLGFFRYDQIGHDIGSDIDQLGSVLAGLYTQQLSTLLLESSIITRLLKEQLCAKCSALIVCNVSGEQSSLYGNKQALNFATKTAKLSLGRSSRGTGSSGGSFSVGMHSPKRSF